MEMLTNITSVGQSSSSFFTAFFATFLAGAAAF
jgi:hypothetical protein